MTSDSHKTHSRRRFLAKLVGGITLALALVVFGFIQVEKYFVERTCGNEIHTSVLSPDSKHKVTALTRNCGVGSSYGSMVVVGPANEDPPIDDLESRLITIVGRAKFGLSWNTDHQIRITYESWRRKPTLLNVWRGVSVSVQPGRL